MIRAAASIRFRARLRRPAAPGQAWSFLFLLAAGKRRVCCFDRSGFYSKGFSAPAAAD
jgi:hypothetical protein